MESEAFTKNQIPYRIKETGCNNSRKTSEVNERMNDKLQ